MSDVPWHIAREKLRIARREAPPLSASDAALVIESDAPETEEARCPHPKIVPIDADWGRCTACGDSTFPLSDFAAGMPVDPDIDDLIAKSSIGAGLADIEERGIDAHLADLEMAPKKKRKKSKLPSARTLEECRKRGWVAGIVERRIPFPRPRGTTIDLLGVIDIVALDMAAPPGQRTVGIQATTGNGGRHAEHRVKILAEPRALTWLQAGNRLELWSWALQGARGQRKKYTLRVEAFTVEDWSKA